MTSSTIQNRQHENRRQYFSLADSTVYRKYIIYSTLFNKTEHLICLYQLHRSCTITEQLYLSTCRTDHEWRNVTGMYWHKKNLTTILQKVF